MLSRAQTIILGAGKEGPRIGVLTGVSGSGKDFLLQSAFDRILTRRVTAISTGTWLADHLRSDRDAIRENVTTDDLRGAVRTYAHAFKDQGNTIHNAHLVVRHLDGYFFNDEFLHILEPDYIIAVYSDPEAIRIRRLQNSRPRAAETTNQIAAHQGQLHLKLISWCRKREIQYAIILNDEDTRATEQNTQFLQEFLQVPN